MFSYIWQTNSGSQWAINQAIKFSKQNITIGKINGDLSNGLEINNFKYNSENIDIKAEHIKYQSDFLWFSRHLDLNHLRIKQLEITPKQTKVETTSEPFKGIKLPLSVDIKNAQIDEIVIHNQAKPQNIDQIKISALINRQDVELRSLKVNSHLLDLTTSGHLDYRSGLAYQLNTSWHIQLDEQTLKGSGLLNGNLESVELDQEITIDKNGIQSEINLVGLIENFTTTPKLNLDVNTDKMTIDQQSGHVELTNLSTQIKGPLTDYNINLKTVIQQADLPMTEVMITADGDLNSIKTETMQLSTAEGLFTIQATANWQEQINLTAQISIDNFNPQIILNDWPGSVNGTMEVSIIINESGPIINIADSELMGAIKQHPFELTGKLNYQSNELLAENFIFSLGANSIQLNGQLNRARADLIGRITMPELELMHNDLSGLLQGEISVSGTPLKPTVQMNLIGEGIEFQNSGVARLTIDSSGQWEQTINTQISANDLQFKDQVIDSITIEQTGWIDNHQIDIKATQGSINSRLSASGSLKQDENIGWQWLGQLKQHVLNIDQNHQLNLQQAVAIEITDQIKIDQACWLDQSAGSLCIMLDVKNDDQALFNEDIAAQLTISNFDIKSLSVLMPESLNLTGLLQGDVNAQLTPTQLQLDADLTLDEGLITLQKEGKISYQTNISQFDLTASSNDQETIFTLISRLADDSYLNLDSKLSRANDNTWHIDTDIKAMVTETRIIQDLRPEISDFNGNLGLTGNINGPVLKPIINLDVTQPEGFVKLSRFGTILEQLSLNIKTEGINQPIYQIILSAQNLNEINQGQFNTQGEFSMSPNGWQYQGKITGDNFMVINLPEMKFNLSPDLKIEADTKEISVAGQVNVDYGHVIVEQLPPSTVSNSSDLVIITSENATESDYPIILDIQANIIDSIELDVIGLEAGLTGSINLKQNTKQPLQGNGVLNLANGTYEIYGQKLSIDRGELAFTGPLENPKLDVRASRLSEDETVTAGVELGGTVNNLQSTLFSDPSLQDIEKLSYIMTGRGLEGSGNLNGEQLKQAAIVMGLNQSSPLFNQIQSQFGIDVLTVRESSFANDTVVEAGKKINDRLYVSFNQGLFNRLGFWVLKYKINQYLNLQSTQGDDQAIELVYTRKAEIPKKKIKQE